MLQLCSVDEQRSNVLLLAHQLHTNTICINSAQLQHPHTTTMIIL